MFVPPFVPEIVLQRERVTGIGFACNPAQSLLRSLTGQGPIRAKVDCASVGSEDAQAASLDASEVRM
jgi:hypothetical protein